jgi:tRNA pseudouridine38-40 synthase
MTLFDPSDAAAPSGPSLSFPTQRIRIVLAYDGARFHGFAAQPGQRTVGGALAEAIRTVVQRPVELTCAGRTDAGVHAWGQVVSVDLPEGTDLERLQRSLVKLLAPAIVVRDVVEAPADFDARFSARSRTYRYRVHHAALPDPFTAHLAWHVPGELDRALLDLACDPFLGEHDFSAFCRRPKAAAGQPPASLVRRVLRAGWDDLGEGHLRFEIEATAFCHQMVRSIVGTIVAAGQGTIRPGDVHAILRSGQRANAAPIAPGHGLCLWHVAYEQAGWRRRWIGS